MIKKIVSYIFAVILVIGLALFFSVLSVMFFSVLCAIIQIPQNVIVHLVPIFGGLGILAGSLIGAEILEKLRKLK